MEQEGLIMMVTSLAVGISVAKRLVNNDPQIKSITFFSDSSSVISNISHTHIHPSQQLSILFSKHALEVLEGNNESHIQITWVPGHNKLADREATRGCQRDGVIQASLSYHKEKAMKIVLRGW